MKADYDYLKADMDRQRIINRQLMERVLRDHVGVLDANRKPALASMGAAILITLAAAYVRGLDMCLAGMIAAFYALMLIGYVFIYHKLGKIESGDRQRPRDGNQIKEFQTELHDRQYRLMGAGGWSHVLPAA